MVSRPYDSFVSDVNLEMFRVKQYTEEKENNAAMTADAVGDPEQGQLGNDDNYGDDGGFDEDYFEEHVE
ncbi:hypothetical protein FRX31_009323 [Thalictrum thalictroides]|uniref:Uncharacterized protein n=1 Tax=Thalictrum thalictroides TaxID=46969 RepID=A0A7J6WUJ2_THATH|nr:hypothetical protein FRX31_009323 [Thalictrum thalictroides]